MLFSILVSTLQFSGDHATIEKGLLDGLKPGDRGKVYYLLRINDREIRVDATIGSVDSCLDERCVLSLEDEVDPSEGYFFEIDLPETRTSVNALAEIARSRLAEGDFDSAEKVLVRLRDTNADGRRLATQIQNRLADERSKLAHERERASLLEQSQDALRSGNLAQFPALVEQLRRVDTPADELGPLLHQFNQIRETRMVRIEAGRYPIGSDVADAHYYNQTPRFERQLDSFWIDRWPVTESEFSNANDSGTAGAPPKTSITYAQAEAHCRALGKRLPSEFEWEAAAALDRLSLSNASEWTGSWYQAYPGNNQNEAEFGESFRVLRGPDGNGNLDIRQRFFMAPSDRAADVTFRCAAPILE